MDDSSKVVAALREQVSEQLGFIEDLKKAVVASEERTEERQKASHQELMKMMTELLLKNNDSERESGGPATVGAAGGAAAPSNPSAQLDGEENHEEGDVGSAEADLYQLGGRGQAGDYVPQGEQSSHTPGSSAASRSLQNMVKTMKLPLLEKGKDIEAWKREAHIYMKMLKFDRVFYVDPYVDVGSPENSRESMMAKGVSGNMYDRQLAAYMFLSQALTCEVDRAIFYRSRSPREAWEELLAYHGPTTNEQKRALQSQMFSFKNGEGKDPVQGLCSLEDLAAKMDLAGIPIDANTVYTSFMNGLPPSEYEHEIRDIGLMKDYDREEIVRLVRNRYETLQTARDKKKKSVNMHGLVCQERGKGRRGGGGRGKAGRGRGGRRSGREDSSDGTAAGEGVTCWRCKGKGHYSDTCTVKLCERCGGRGHDSSNYPTPVEHANLLREVNSCSDSDSTTESMIAAGF